MADAVDIYPHLMKMTFAMVAPFALWGQAEGNEDIDAVSQTICTVQEFIVRQTLQPYLNPWFEVSGELRRHEAMRARAGRHSDGIHQDVDANSRPDTICCRP